jgi:membrane protease subunit HflK
LTGARSRLIYFRSRRVRGGPERALKHNRKGIPAIMNWDWDKLQEKRQRQQGGKPPPIPQGDGKDGDGGEEREKPGAKRTVFSTGGGGGGNPFQNFPPRFRMPGRSFLFIIPAIALLWLLSGIYIVNPDEQGVVLRFGRYDRTEGPGPHYAWPVPIESVYKPQVTQVLRSEVGFRSVGQAATFQQGQLRTVPEEASTLTGDENIVNVQFSVQYKISEPVAYLFNVSAPTALVRNAAEAAMREVIGNSQIDAAITDGKLKIQSEATQLLQTILNRYGSGIQVLAVQLQDVHPPQEVIDAFKDVASAREDKSRIINEAEAYRNELLPRARGQAAAVRNEAQAYTTTRVQNAEGEADRFDALRVEYEKAADVTKKRMYYEAVEEVLSLSREKVLLDGAVAKQALPLLPLPGVNAPPAGKGGQTDNANPRREQ